MKKLLFKSTLFFLLIAASTVPLLFFISSDFSDKFYNKFRYKAPSLILGSSRVLLSIDPESVNKKNWMSAPVLNYGFTQSTSPYGAIYYKSICKKIQRGKGTNYFILEVNPVGLSIDRSKSRLPEEGLILDRLTFFNLDPNFDYILENAQQPLYLFFLEKVKKAKDEEMFHHSGWMENPPVSDTLKQQKRMESQTKEYEKVFSTYSISDYRKKWFEKTVTELTGSNGRIFIVRVPVGEKMKQMEDAYCPDFSAMVSDIAAKHGVRFLDFSGKKGYEFNDLHHMTGSSAVKFSELLGDTLQKIDVLLSK